MKKRIIGAIFVVGFLVSCSLSVSSIGIDDFKKITETKTIPKEILHQLVDENITEGIFVINFGPVSNNYVTANIANVSEGINREFVYNHLNGSIPFLSRILPIRTKLLLGMNYSLEFSKKLYNPRSRFFYYSLVAEYVMNETSGEVNITNMTYKVNTPHKIEVTNFTGFFYFYRARLFSPFKILHPGPHRVLLPAEFALIGTCDNATFVE